METCIGYSCVKLREMLSKHSVGKVTSIFAFSVTEYPDIRVHRCIVTFQVMGGSGDYFAAADTVIVMENYIPSDRTQEAHNIAAQHAAVLHAAADTLQAPLTQPAAASGVWFTPRVPLAVHNRVAGNGHQQRDVKTHVRTLHHIQVITVCDRACIVLLIAGGEEH